MGRTGIHRFGASNEDLADGFWAIGRSQVTGFRADFNVGGDTSGDWEVGDWPVLQSPSGKPSPNFSRKTAGNFGVVHD